MDEIKRKYDDILAYCNSTTAGFQHEFLDVSAQDVAAEEREALFEELYYKSGYGIWVGNYQDIFTNKISNDLISDFIAKKVRQRVKDPTVAELLIPKYQGFGLKRVPMEDRYYEAFNQDNVTLVDLLQQPIDQITPRQK